MGNNHGGARPGAGRKSKAEEQELIEKLTPLEPLALSALENALQDGQRWAVRLYFEYAYGRPAQQIKTDLVAEQPLFPELTIRRQIVRSD